MTIQWQWQPLQKELGIESGFRSLLLFLFCHIVQHLSHKQEFTETEAPQLLKDEIKGHDATFS